MRLFLLSDLHFGRANPDLVAPLLATIEEAAPDRVVIAGDFVQRARASHFRPACEFLERLPVPWDAVPGNHDIPLYNLPQRVLAPRAAYRHWIATETEPRVASDDAVIVGVDTTHRWHHQRGIVRRGQIRRVAEEIRANATERAVVILAHHPFHQSSEIEKRLMLNAPRALESWADAGPHIVLTGHLHKWTVEPFVTRKNKSMTLQVHCGTGLSTRLRGEPNDCAILDVSAERVTIERLSVPEGEFAFIRGQTYSYEVGDAGWINVGNQTSDAG
ncbi:metallophosphoesterase family protein [Algicella marina]|uniref:Metallophosphoesterase n=1 Tax=Algicella marina TaxID=2683284 RepID=A0A6P1T0P7_9RHOB|nr:metallophosphoesterase [Algicella marina]QHQ36484.1 metallophosphoesterase [Algicella marina]